ncbi:MAG: SCO family protein [bacterium]
MIRPSHILFIFLAFLTAAGGCSNDRGNQTQKPSPQEIKKQLPASDLIGTSINNFPDTGLVTHSENQFYFEELPGKPLIISFMYTRCPMAKMCPLITRKMKKVRSSLLEEGHSDFKLVTVTFDPDHDTPAVLRKYRRSRKIEATNWTFVTGPGETVDALVDRFKISTKQTESGQIVHNLRTYLIDQNGTIKKWYRGSQWNVDTVTDDLRKLI